jgi:hypothetical protein
MAIADAPRVAAGLVSDITDNLYGTTYTDALEQVPALMYPDNISTFGKMRFDPQISATLKAYTLPLRGPENWAVNPRGCRDEVVEVIADAFGLPILGNNDGPGPFRRRGVLWSEHLRMALLMLVYGHMPFAIAGEVTGEPLRWRLTELSERLPSTISEIKTDPAGHLLWIKQNIGGPNPPKIPASNLLWYVHEREGAAWWGRSMLREAYGPWLLKHEMWRVLATSSRRFGMGVPTVYAPAGGTQAEVDAAATYAAAARVGDQSGQGLPDGFRFELTGMTGSTPDTLGFVRYLDQQMAQSVLATVLNLDASPNGSRALGDTMVDLLRLAWKATAEEIAVPASQLAVRIVDWNFSEDEPVPGILCPNLGQSDASSDAISALVACGALTPDDGMDATLRHRYGFPERTTPIPAAQAPGAPSGDTPNDNPAGGTGTAGEPAAVNPPNPRDLVRQS